MDISFLNLNVGGEPVSGYQGDGHEIEELCKAIGCSLPQSYVDFIRQADGGHPELGSFSLEGDDKLDFDIDWFYSFSNKNIEQLKDVYEEWKPVLDKKMLPIGRDGGGSQILLQLGSESETVLFLRDDSTKEYLKVSSSFSAFIKKLTTNPDFT